MNTWIYRSMFQGIAAVGRPFGGIPPRRITYWLGDRAFVGRLKEADYRSCRDHWGSAFRLNPYYFLDRNIIAFGSFEPHLHRFIASRVRPGMVCFDVGANIGVMAVHLGRRVGTGGKVYAFEPVPRIRARLDEHVAMNALGAVVEVSQIALSDRDGEASMAVAPEEIGNQGMASLVNKSSQELSEKFTVPTMTVDAFVKGKGIARIDLMKVDIQGAEPLLLAGGEHVFGTVSPDLLLEISPGDLAGLGRTGKDLVAQIEGYGYTVYELETTGRPGKKVDVARLLDGATGADVYCTKARP